jgi:hypothetical protein
MPGLWLIHCSLCGKPDHNRLTCGRHANTQRALVRRWQREGCAKRREARRAAGLCFICGEVKLSDEERAAGRTACHECRVARSAQIRAWREAKKETRT